MLFGPSGKGRKGQKKGEKGRFRPISRTGGQIPLKPPFVTPPFAALQGIDFGKSSSGITEQNCLRDLDSLDNHWAQCRYRIPRSTLPKCFGNYFRLFRWRNYRTEIALELRWASLKATFSLKGIFDFLRLCFKELEKYPLKQGLE